MIIMDLSNTVEHTFLPLEKFTLKTAFLDAFVGTIISTTSQLVENETCRQSQRY